MSYLTEPLDTKQKQHEIVGFDCGNPALNTWLTTQAGQAARKGHSATYVITNGKVVVAYFAIAVRKFYPTVSLPSEFSAEFPAGANVTVLARLGGDKTQQGKGVGRVLMREVLQRVKAMAAETGDVFLYVDAKDGVAGFYEKYGFTPSATDPDILLLRIDEIP